MSPKSTKTKSISRLVQPAVRKLTAYHIVEEPVRVKLDAMENPFPLPQDVRRDVAEAIERTLTNRYPDPSAKNLKKAIAAFWGIDAERMILGNGSDELIQAVVLAFGGPVLIPVPTFAMYEITSRALSQSVATVPLKKDFSLDADRLIKKAKQIKAKVVFLACPNNPTGNRFADDAVRKVLESVNAAVVIDEAYFDFSGKSFLPFLDRHPNMIVLRTLSKIGLAGLRVGMLAAAPEVIEELNKIRLPYNINVLSQAAGIAVLKHRETLKAQISLLISERGRLYNALSRLQGITPFPSETNFILFRTNGSATRIFTMLKQQGILIKNLDRPGPLRNCLRVTVGAPEENNEFIGQMQGILATDSHG
jgi:histidinol-phosphate aminotransferase